MDFPPAADELDEELDDEEEEEGEEAETMGTPPTPVELAQREVERSFASGAKVMSAHCGVFRRGVVCSDVSLPGRYMFDADKTDKTAWLI